MSKNKEAQKNRIENAIIGRKNSKKKKTKDLKPGQKGHKNKLNITEEAQRRTKKSNIPNNHITHKEREKHVQIPKGKMSSVHN